MKNIFFLFLLVFTLYSFNTKNNADVIEVTYDSQPIDLKKGIKLQSGKMLQIINKSGGKIYKVEVLVSLGKRPCYETVYLKEDAAKPIAVSTFINGACADAKSIILVVNVSTTIVIPII